MTEQETRPGAQPRLSDGARWVIGAALTMAVAMGISRFAYTPLLPDMRNAFHWTLTQAGDLGSMNYLGYLLGALAAPRCARSSNLHSYLGLALMGCVLTTWAGAFTSDYLAWCAIRLASGIASAFCLVLVTAQLGALLTAAERPRLGNLHFSGVGFGIICSVLIIGNNMTSDPLEVAARWTQLAGLAAALLLPAWALFRTVALPVSETPTSHSQAERAPRSPSLWRVILGYGGFGFGYIITATFIIEIAQQQAASNTATGPGVNQIWLAAGIAALPSVWLWQSAANRFGNALVLAAAYMVEAIGVLIAAFGSSHGHLLLAGALLGGTFAGITALGLSLAQRLAPAQMARNVGLMTALFAVGQLLGPAVAARLAVIGGGFGLPSVVAAAILVLAAILLWGVHEQSAKSSSILS
ncbi:MAG: YbfB/YjiJ family MFS transporter [Pseudomonadales bacterium]